MRRTSCLAIALATSLFLAACGGSTNYSSGTSPTGNSVPMTPMILTIGDTPPSGVAVLFLEAVINKATLQPSDPMQFVTQLAQFTELSNTTQMAADLTAIRTALTAAQNNTTNS